MDAKQQATTSISVITATYNAAAHLPRLIESLHAQTDKDFEWVIADGNSTDNTLELIRQQSSEINIKITVQADFGIYDGLNRAIKNCTGEYYVVAGADDFFYSNAIADFKQAILSNSKSKPDIVAANVRINEQVVEPMNKAPWLYGMRSYVASHSLGTLFKKTLHERFGYYSNKLPITADNLFILKVLQDKAVVFKQIPNMVGCYASDGLSGSDIVGSLTENFRAQLMLGSNKYLQLAILVLRLLKNSTRL